MLGEAYGSLCSILRLFFSNRSASPGGGDFNEIKSIDEKKGCVRRDRGMADFCNFISSLELIDLPMFGRKFAWCNSMEGEK